MTIKFDAKNFTTPRTGPWDRIKEARANFPRLALSLKFRRAPTKGLGSNVDVLYCSKTKTTMVIVENPSTRGAEYGVTTYWGANPKQVLATVRGERKFLDLDGEFTWSGGSAEMSCSKVYDHIAALSRLAGFWDLIQHSEGNPYDS